MDMSTGTFRCEHCSSELRQTFAGGGEVGDDGDRRHHVMAMKDLLSKVEAQCKPITDQLARIQGAIDLWWKPCFCVVQGVHSKVYFCPRCQLMRLCTQPVLTGNQ